MIRPCIALWWALSAPAAAAPPDCSTPQNAAETLFDWLRTDSYDPDTAATCLDTPPDVAGGPLAVQFQTLLDARGIFFPIAGLPDEADHVDATGKAQVIPVPDALPSVSIEQGDDGQWRFSRRTAEGIPDLYASTFSPLSLWFQNRLPPGFYARFLGLHLWQYVYTLLMIVVAWALGAVVVPVLRSQINRVLARSKIDLHPETYRRTNRPIVLLVVCGFLYWMVPDVQLPHTISVPLTRLLWIGVWVSALVAAFRFIAVGADAAASFSRLTDSKLDDQAIPLLRQSAQLLLVVFGGLYFADAVGFDVWKLAAGVGIGGLAFALAAQDTVANVFGSINIFLDRPFQIGDWVQVGDVEGVVEEVGFRSTRVRTFYNSLVTIPNSQITNANVDNLGLRPRRRIKHVVGLTYDTPPDKLEAYAEGIRAILAAHPYVQRTYEVHVYNLADSAIEILVYYHVVTPGWHEELATRAQNLLEIIRLASTLEVSFAFPSTSLYLESTPEHPLPEHASPPLDQLQEVFDSFGPKGGRSRPLGPRFGRSWSVQARTGEKTRGSADDGG